MTTKKIIENTGFEVIKSVDLEELQITLTEFVHQKSQAQVVYLGCDDPENVFTCFFRTLPDSSNGVAHILEHTVLCGSKKYPVRDPFFSMTRRSLNTFMNALTGADFTCYPLASQVEKDFYNLLSVYLDAVFHPLLDELSFKQEGWRYDFTEEGELEFKGIVFNEMKGALANPEARLWNRCMEKLLPDLTYRYESGGDPAEIPKLSYQEFIEFHQRYYHPSRCVFCFYGNFSIEKHLKFLDETLLSQVKPVEPLPLLPRQTLFESPKKDSCTYPVAAGEAKEDGCFIAYSWLTCSILEQEEVLALLILEIILMGTDAALLKYPLLQSGLCKQISVYIDTEMSEIPVLFIFKGCKKEDQEKISQELEKNLEELAQCEIPERLIEAALHQLEMYRCEISSDSDWPYGLTLFFRSVLLKQQGGQLEDGLLVHSLFSKLRKKLKDPKYLPSLISKYFIKNTHSLITVMSPSESLSEEELQKEKDYLKQVYSKLKEEDKERIKKEAHTLNESQEAQMDLSVLPKVTLEDVHKECKNFILSVRERKNLQVYHQSSFTNGFIYANLVFDLPFINPKDYSPLRFFSHILGQLGAGERTYKEQLEYIQAKTGGISSTLSFYTNVEGVDHYNPVICFRGKALERNHQDLWILFQESIMETHFNDYERVEELLEQHYTSLEQNLPRVALRYAMSEAQKSLGEHFQLSDAWSGLQYFRYIRDLYEHRKDKLPSFIETANRLIEYVFSGKRDLILTCSEEGYTRSFRRASTILGRIPLKKKAEWKSPSEEYISTPEGYIIASPVAFTCQAIRSLPYSHPLSPALSIASQLMDNLVLHKRIREQGGAYGAGSSNHSNVGSFYFYAYRDPHLSATLAAFKEGVESIGSGMFNEQELEEAKLGLLKGMDAPVSPSARGNVAYSWMREGKTTAVRQAYRERLLKATKEEVVHVLKEHVLPQLSNATLSVFSDKNLLEKEGGILKQEGRSFTVASV